MSSDLMMESLPAATRIYISRMRNLGFTNNQILGHFFVLGAVIAEMGAGANIVEGARHPFMHRTDSLDYVVVLTGEIYMMMDEDEYLLKAGDVVVQQGTNHALVKSWV